MSQAHLTGGEQGPHVPPGSFKLALDMCSLSKFLISPNSSHRSCLLVSPDGYTARSPEVIRSVKNFEMISEAYRQGTSLKHLHQCK